MRPWNSQGPASAAALLTLAMALAASSPAAACSPTIHCTLADGSYLVRPPDRWDGHALLPVVLFLHGYTGSAEDVMADTALGETMSALGVMLVAPQGLKPEGRGRSWSFPGKLETARDDVAFLENVAADVARRFPVDPDRLVASGFSVGGSMVWSLACNGQGRFSAYAPVAGAFWVPEQQDCPAGPQNIRHVHGTADRVVPMTGRSIGRGFRQGDVLKSMATWRSVGGCRAEPRLEVTGALTCSRWDATSCSSGRELVLCLHDGEHEMNAAWIGDAVRWADGLAKRRAPSAAPRP